MVQQLQNVAAELTHKLEEQEAENALLHKVHARKQQGLVAQGPSELQQQEQTRLKAQRREFETLCEHLWRLSSLPACRTHSCRPQGSVQCLLSPSR